MHDHSLGFPWPPSFFESGPTASSPWGWTGGEIVLKQFVVVNEGIFFLSAVLIVLSMRFMDLHRVNPHVSVGVEKSHQLWVKEET